VSITINEHTYRIVVKKNSLRFVPTSTLRCLLGPYFVCGGKRTSIGQQFAATSESPAARHGMDQQTCFEDEEHGLCAINASDCGALDSIVCTH
jgi:hypothetical protein